MMVGALTGDCGVKGVESGREVVAVSRCARESASEERRVWERALAGRLKLGVTWRRVRVADDGLGKAFSSVPLLAFSEALRERTETPETESMDDRLPFFE